MNKTNTLTVDEFKNLSKHKEQDLQTKIAKWLKKEYSGLIFFSDFAAGLYLKPYLANIRSLQACEGRFLDLTLLEPVNNYHGLLVEIKVSVDDLFLKDGMTLKSEHVQEQFSMVKKLRAKGYAADFGCGEDDIKQIIINYFSGVVNYKTIIERKIKINTSLDDFFDEYYKK